MKKLKFKGIFFLKLIIFLGGDDRGLVGWNFDKYFSNFEEKIIFFKFEKNKLP